MVYIHNYISGKMISFLIVSLCLLYKSHPILVFVVQKHVFMPLCLIGNYITAGKLQIHVAKL